MERLSVYSTVYTRYSHPSAQLSRCNARRSPVRVSASVGALFVVALPRWILEWGLSLCEVAIE